MTETYYARNREASLKRAKKHYLENKDRYKDYNRIYHLTHKEIANERARKRNQLKSQLLAEQKKIKQKEEIIKPKKPFYRIILEKKRIQQKIRKPVILNNKKLKFENIITDVNDKNEIVLQLDF